MVIMICNIFHSCLNDFFDLLSTSLESLKNEDSLRDWSSNLSKSLKQDAIQVIQSLNEQEHYVRFIFHGTYTKNISLSDYTLSLSIPRILDKLNKKTHAFLPDDLIPGSNKPSVLLHPIIADSLSDSNARIYPVPDSKRSLCSILEPYIDDSWFFRIRSFLASLLSDLCLSMIQDAFSFSSFIHSLSSPCPDDTLFLSFLWKNIQIFTLNNIDRND